MPQLSDPEWVTDLAFLVDITTHMNALNTKLQSKDQLTHKLFEHVCAFEVKLRLWERQLQQFNYAHFPMLAEIQPADAAVYVAFIAQLREQLATRFTELRASSQDFALFSNTFDAVVDNVPVHLQMELVDLRCDSDLKSKFADVPIIQFYKEYIPKDKFPGLMTHARMMAALFGSIYIGEQLFSKMNFAKCKTRTQLSDAHLEGTLRLASTQLEPDIQGLVQRHQHQIAH